MISITEEIVVPSPRDRVWQVISNPADVVSCINGAELGAAHDDGSFDGTLPVKFGAVRVRFGARVKLDLVEDEYEGRLSARGKDGQAATRFAASATFRVLEGLEAGSRVVVSGEIELSGKLAGLVESGAGAVVSRMTRDFSAALVARCAEPAATATTPASPAAAPRAAPEPSRAGAFARLRAWWTRLWHRPQTAGPSPEPPVIGLPEDGGW